MSYAKTTATKKIANLTKRIRIVQGGTSASKTISVLIYLIVLAQTDTKPKLASIVSESFPHLRRGAMRDFLNIMQEHGYYKDKEWDKTNSNYTFSTGSQIEFFSVDQPGKVRGPRRDRLFGNECNNWSFETFEQLEVRTNDFIILDYNYVSDFWIEEVASREDSERIILTYKDNEALSPEIVKSIESRQHRKDWWQVYGLGLKGELEGIIYPNWKIIDEIPPEARLERRWLDFGYTNDPTAIGDLWYWNGAYILDEQLYQTGLSNKQIADFLINLPQSKTLVIADSAEPKSIDEIKSFGINIMPTLKGKDSVKQGIQVVQAQTILVTKRSIDILKEKRNYTWLVDRDGRVLNQEDPMCANHHMSGVRYAICSLVPIIRNKEMLENMPRIWGNEEVRNPAL